MLHGCRGMIGKALVFRMVKGLTVVSAAPVRKAPYTAAQKQQQELFKQAMAYARARMKDAGLKTRYVALAKARGGSTNPFNMAIREYFRIRKMKEVIAAREVHGGWFAGFIRDRVVDQGLFGNEPEIGSSGYPVFPPEPG